MVDWTRPIQLRNGEVVEYVGPLPFGLGHAIYRVDKGLSSRENSGRSCDFEAEDVINKPEKSGLAWKRFHDILASRTYSTMTVWENAFIEAVEEIYGKD